MMKNFPACHIVHLVGDSLGGSKVWKHGGPLALSEKSGPCLFKREARVFTLEESNRSTDN